MTFYNNNNYNNNNNVNNNEILELSKSGENNPVNFKKANQRQVEEITNRINNVIDKIPTRTRNEQFYKCSKYVCC